MHVASRTRGYDVASNATTKPPRAMRTEGLHPHSNRACTAFSGTVQHGRPGHASPPRPPAVPPAQPLRRGRSSGVSQAPNDDVLRPQRCYFYRIARGAATRRSSQPGRQPRTNSRLRASPSASMMFDPNRLIPTVVDRTVGSMLWCDSTTDRIAATRRGREARPAGASSKRRGRARPQARAAGCALHSSLAVACEAVPRRGFCWFLTHARPKPGGPPREHRQAGRKPS